MTGFTAHAPALQPLARPVIGVTGPDRGGWPAWYMTARALRRAGAHPLRLTPSLHRGHRPLDGLVLGGGADVAPALYGGNDLNDLPPDVRPPGPWHRRVASGLVGGAVYLLRRLLCLPQSAGPDPQRDALEMELLAAADRRGLPVLGICRGAQLMNVFAQGDLHRRIAAYADAPMWTVWPKKRVALTAGSALRNILGSAHCYVNSLHRQAIRRVSQRFSVAARDDLKVVQAIESHDHKWIGVQWHPEFLPQQPEQQRLFDCLTEKARALGARTA